MSQLSAWALLSGKLNKLHCGDTGAPWSPGTHTPPGHAGWQTWWPGSSHSPPGCGALWTSHPASGHVTLTLYSAPCTCVNVLGPVLRMCQSRRRIQETCSHSQGLISTIYDVSNRLKSIFHCKFSKNHVGNMLAALLIMPFPFTTVLRVIKIQFYRIILQVVSDLAAKDGGGAKVSRYICCLTALENNWVGDGRAWKLSFIQLRR